MKLVNKQHAEYKAKQAHYCNKCQCEFQVGWDVWVSDNEHTRGEVLSPAAVTPRSYIVNTPSGQLRRNSRHLVPVPEEQSEDPGTKCSREFFCRGDVAKHCTGTHESL